MEEGSHKPIIEKKVFDPVQNILKQRRNQTRRLRTPNYLTWLVKCGECGAPIHVTYPGIEPKRRFKYYVCNNRYYFKSYDQDYIRADILEGSVIKEIEKLSRRREVIFSLVQDYVSHNRERVPELESERKEVLKKINLLEKEKEKFSRWLLREDITTIVVNHINTLMDEYENREATLKQELWEVEDKITSIQHKNYNAEGLSDYLKDFVNSFNNTLDFGERKLFIEAPVDKVVIRDNKKVTIYLQPPLPSLGFITPSLALRV